jgi:thiamine-monophosphate kinase
LNLSSIGEFGLIERIAEKVARAEGVCCGIGDDAAALAPSSGLIQLVTTDMLLDGVHFDLSYTPMRLLGRKSLAVNLSDIAAMGGKPKWFLLSLGLPEGLSLNSLDLFTAGILEMADSFGIPLVGGDTCRSANGLTISVTVIGEQLPEKVIYRNGAKAGDLVCVTGTLGDSALGLLELRKGIHDGHAVERHLDPIPRCREALSLADEFIPTAMMDISDGMIADLGHILKASGVGAVICPEKIPLSPYFKANAEKLTAVPLNLALAGGEDYELLFTVPAGRLTTLESFSSKGFPVAVIGEITADKSLYLLSSSGELIPPASTGFIHF